jgi:hypothetical protein
MIKRQREYVTWSNHHAVLTLADNYMKDGHPFRNPISSRTSLLNEMKTMRNAIAHRSEDSELKLQSLIRSQIGYLPTNMDPGSFLLENESTTGLSYFDYYLDTLLTIAKQII